MRNRSHDHRVFKKIDSPLATEFQNQISPYIILLWLTRRNILVCTDEFIVGDVIHNFINIVLIYLNSSSVNLITSHKTKHIIVYLIWCGTWGISRKPATQTLVHMRCCTAELADEGGFTISPTAMNKPAIHHALNLAGFHTEFHQTCDMKCHWKISMP